MKNKKPQLLVILDGYGYRKALKGNAIAQAHAPFMTKMMCEYPHAFLEASGTAVGLPEGYIGNSQVGHMTIGAGRIIEQPVTQINSAIENGSFFKNPELIAALETLKKKKSTLHIMGLLSDAGVHSHLDHLFAFIKAAVQHKIQKIVIHPFVDGRDVATHSASDYLKKLEKFIKPYPQVSIGSIHGRLYAMDRDNNFDRSLLSYYALTKKGELEFNSWQEGLLYYYDLGLTEEFIPPFQLHNEGLVKAEDGIIFFNFRPDRARQLTSLFVAPERNNVAFIPLTFFITPVMYESELPTTVLFPQTTIEGTLKELLSREGKTIFSIAETEKYAHVTYFFDGRHEAPFATETRVLVPSIKTKSFAPFPCMSAPEITKKVIASLTSDPADFYLINYANADMVGHSGDMAATVKAIECLDRQLAELYSCAIEKLNGTMYITADHGKAEQMISPDDTKNTAHTTNKVPFIMIEKDLADVLTPLPVHQLADIAQLILKHMGITSF